MSNNNNLKRLNILLRTISKINQQLVISSDEKKLCQKICHYLIRIKGYKFVWMGLKESNNDEITPVAIAGKDKDFVRYIKNSWNKYGFNGCPTSIALESGIPFLIEDLKNEERFVPWDRNAIENGFLSALVLPIKYHNDVIGTLHIYSDTKNYFLKEEVLFLKEVAGDLSIGIKSIRDERELIESKREYEELFKRISSCVAIYKAKDNGNDFIIKDFNQAAEKAEKIKREDIIGKSVLKVFPSVKDFGLFDVFRRVYKTGRSENHPISIYKDKRISGWRENFVYKLPNGNVVAVYNDLTEKKQAEEELIRASERLALAQKSAGAGIWDWDMNTEKLNWSTELYNLFGLDPKKDTATFDTWRKVLHPEDRQLAEERINKSIKEHKPLFQEYRIIMPSGEIRWINAFGDTIYDEHGKAVRMSGICVDVTDRKKSQNALKLSEGRYHDLFENMLEGFAYCRLLYDKDGRPYDWVYLDVNKRFELLTTLKDVIGKRVTEIIPGIKDSNPELFEIYNRVALTGQPESFEDYIEPLSIWLHISVFSQLKEHFIAVFHNITELYESREKIIKSLENTQKTLNSTINSLASIVEIKDPYTSGHQVKVKQLSVAIAKEMGLDKDTINAISTAAIVHDIGKVIIPASMLSKPSTLSELEFAMVKTHSQAGYDIIKEIDFGYPVADIILQHHERLDGSGYPSGLKGTKIMLEAKIIAVADVVEAMSSHRPYRPSLGIEKALEEIELNKNTLYDSVVVDTCISIINKKGFKFQ